MTALPVLLGNGRLGRALHKAAPETALLSSRDSKLEEKLVELVKTESFLLILTRRPDEDLEDNIRAIQEVVNVAKRAGFPEDRVVLSGSYAACSAYESSYATEKRKLEELVVAGKISGRVLRLPPVELLDDNFLGILGELKFLVSSGLVRSDIRFTTVTVNFLINELSVFPIRRNKIEIMKGKIQTAKELVAKFEIPPSFVRNRNSARAAWLTRFSAELKMDPLKKTHYEDQCIQATF
jgi:hypothetical protein